MLAPPHKLSVFDVDCGFNNFHKIFIKFYKSSEEPKSSEDTLNVITI